MQNPVTDSSAGSPPKEGASRWSSVLRSFIHRHPYWSTLLLFVYFQLGLLLLHFLAGPVIALMHLPFLLRSLIGEVLIALVVVTPILMLNWWSEIGFTRGITWRGVVVCIMPIVLLVLPGLLIFPSIAGRTTVSMLSTTTVFVLLIGFAEEGLCRGLLLRSLLPKGIWTSVLLSAGLFAAMHLTNLISGFPLVYVVGQLLLAFGSGALFAAIRLRTRSIWPSLLLHAAHDFPGLLLLAIEPKLALSGSLTGTLIVDSVFCLILLLNTFVLLRPKQWRALRVAYGLAPEPVTPPPGHMPYYQLPPYGYAVGPQPYPQTLPYPQQPYPGYAPGPQPYAPAPSEYVQPPMVWPQADPGDASQPPSLPY